MSFKLDDIVVVPTQYVGMHRVKRIISTGKNQAMKIENILTGSTHIVYTYNCKLADTIANRITKSKTISPINKVQASKQTSSYDYIRAKRGY
jgi:hypothetical protein